MPQIVRNLFFYYIFIKDEETKQFLYSFIYLNLQPGEWYSRKTSDE